MSQAFTVGTPVLVFDERGTIVKTFSERAKREQVLVTLESGEQVLCRITQLEALAEAPVAAVPAAPPLEAPPTAKPERKKKAIVVEPPLPTTAMLEKNAQLLGITVEELRGEPKPAGKAVPIVLAVGDHVVAKRPLSDYRWPVPSWLKSGEPLTVAETGELDGDQICRVIDAIQPDRGPAEGGGWWVTVRDLNVPSAKAGAK